jgi:Kdo2-lipid IVA lauroyltransferase/acyltransferase
MKRPQKNNFFALQYWPTWLGLGTIYVHATMPFWLSDCFAFIIGRLLALVIPKRKRIIQANIRHCYPNKSNREQKQLQNAHLTSLGQGIVDAGIAWSCSSNSILNQSQITGFEHYQHAKKQGKGVIILSAHFTTLEIGARILGLCIPDLHLVKKDPHNPLMAHFINKKRKNYLRTHGITDMHAIRTTLKHHGTVLITPDQDRGNNRTVFVPFMGQQAATLTSISFLANLYGSLVVPAHCVRKSKPGKQSKRYEVIFHPAIQNFPTPHQADDAITVNQVFEKMIALQSKDYFWMHRRFKTTQNGQANIYK